MEIHFLGAGEACDPDQPNTSLLLKAAETETAGRILLDCGFSAPHRYFSRRPDPEELELLWISHFHGDHFFGVPLLLLWFWEMGRRRPLHLAGPPGVEGIIRQALDLAYPNLHGRLNFPLRFIEMTDGGKKEIADTVCRTACNEHSQPCLSLRLETGGKTVFYSGDGRPTRATQSLARGCDIIVHEAYGLQDTTPGHGSIGSCLEFCRRAGVGLLALIHIQRDVRLRLGTVMESFRTDYPEIKILVPEAATTISL